VDQHRLFAPKKGGTRGLYRTWWTTSPARSCLKREEIQDLTRIRDSKGGACKNQKKRHVRRKEEEGPTSGERCKYSGKKKFLIIQMGGGGRALVKRGNVSRGGV